MKSGAMLQMHESPKNFRRPRKAKIFGMPILSLSIFAAMAVLACFSFAVPLWIGNTNSTTPSSPASYSPTADYSFQINFTNVKNTTFQIGSPSGGMANYTDNTSGLVGYWRLNAVNGTNYTKDFSGYGNDGKLTRYLCVPASCNITEGRIGKALAFDGSTNYINMGNPSSLNTTFSSISISLWFKTPEPLATQISNAGLVTKTNTTSADYGVTVTENPESSEAIRGAFMNETGSTLFVDTSGFAPNLNEWYHVAWVYNSTHNNIYVDGKLNNSDELASPNQLVKSYRNKNFVAGVYAGTSWFNGTIDEIRVYNRSLSADEIAAQYQMQYPYYAGTDDSLNGTWAINYTQSSIGGAGVYNYTWFATNSTGGQNSTQTIGYTINKLNNVSLSLALNGTQGDVSYSYGTVSNATAWTNSSVGSIILYRNGTDIGNPENNTLAAKVWNYTAYFSHENYSASQAERMLTISKVATLTRLFLNGTEGNRNYNMSQTANFTVSINISGKTAGLDANISGWGTASGTSPLFNYTQLQQSKVFNITGYFVGDENYSASAATYFANVSSVIGNVTLNLAIHLGAIFADDSLQNGNSYGCVQDGSGWFGLTSENPQQAQSGNLTSDYKINVSFSSDSKAYLAFGKGSCVNFGNSAADAQLKRFLSPLAAFSYAKINLIQLILQFNSTDITNDAHWGKGTYLLSIANQGYNATSAKQNLAVKVVK